MPSSSIGYWCSVVAHQYLAQLQHKLAKLDITSWYYVLLVIEDNAGPLSQQELADMLDLDKVAMTRALDHLEERGYVQRCACAGDRRKHLVKLTPKARPVVKAIRAAYEELNDEALAGVKKADRAAFLTHLMMMVRNLRTTDLSVTYTNKRIHA